MGYVFRKFDITQRFNIEDSKERSQIDQSDGCQKVTHRETLLRQ